MSSPVPDVPNNPTAPEYADFGGAWEDLPTPEWHAGSVVDGFDRRLERLMALVNLMQFSGADDGYEHLPALGELLDREVRGLRVLANRASQLLMQPEVLR